jgi:hypothetical protein
LIRPGPEPATDIPFGGRFLLKKYLSPDRPDDTVLVPESFRGGCSVGAETKRFRPDLSRIVVMDIE